MGGVVRRREQLCGAGRAAACCAVERDRAAGSKRDQAAGRLQAPSSTQREGEAVREKVEEKLEGETCQLTVGLAKLQPVRSSEAKLQTQPKE